MEPHRDSATGDGGCPKLRLGMGLAQRLRLLRRELLGDTPNPAKGLRPLYSGFPNFHELTGVAKPHALFAMA